MPKRRVWGLSMVSMLGASVAFVACGSSDGKRHVAADVAGAAGEGAASSESGAPGTGGKGGTSSAGQAGEPDLGQGAAGADGGAGEPGGQGGSGGAGDAPGGGYSDEPVPGDTFASPTGSDTANDCSVEANPCKTITYAASQAAPDHTVWLASATFTGVDQPVAASVVTGVRVRARQLGEAILQVRLALLGSHHVEGLVFDGGASNTGNPGIDVTTGTVAIEGVAFSGRLGTALKISGDAEVTLAPGELTDYVSDVLAYVDGSGYNPFCEVAGTATLTVAGGTFGGPGLGYDSALPRSAYGAAFAVLGDAELVMDSVTLELRTRGIGLLQNASVRLRNSNLSAVAMLGAGYGVWVTNNAGSAKIEIEGSSITGFNYGGSSAAVAVLEDPPEPTHASLKITDSTLSGSSFGVLVGSIDAAQLDFADVDITNNLFGGVFCQGSCALDMRGGSVSGNGSWSDTTYWGYYGGLNFSATDKAYDIKLRGVTIDGNRNIVDNGNTNALSNSGLSLAGNATSVFDLGTAADPGDNTFTGNDTGNATTNLNVSVNAAVLVSAVGNTFDASTQAASAAGRYVLGKVPCSASTCDLTTGAGANYRVTSGALRLAE